MTVVAPFTVQRAVRWGDNNGTDGSSCSGTVTVYHSFLANANTPITYTLGSLFILHIQWDESSGTVAAGNQTFLQIAPSGTAPVWSQFTAIDTDVLGWRITAATLNNNDYLSSQHKGSFGAGTPSGALTSLDDQGNDADVMSVAVAGSRSWWENSWGLKANTVVTGSYMFRLVISGKTTPSVMSRYDNYAYAITSAPVVAAGRLNMWGDGQSWFAGVM